MSYDDAIAELEEQIKQQAAVIEQMRHIIRRYRDDTPLGNQPYMLAHSADEILTLQPCPEVLNKVRADAVREAACKAFSEGDITNTARLAMFEQARHIEKE